MMQRVCKTPFSRTRRKISAAGKTRLLVSTVASGADGETSEESILRCCRESVRNEHRASVRVRAEFPASAAGPIFVKAIYWSTSYLRKMARRNRCPLTSVPEPRLPGEAWRCRARRAWTWSRQCLYRQGWVTVPGAGFPTLFRGGGRRSMAPHQKKTARQRSRKLPMMVAKLILCKGQLPKVGWSLSPAMPPSPEGSVHLESVRGRSWRGHWRGKGPFLH